MPPQRLFRRAWHVALAALVSRVLILAIGVGSNLAIGDYDLSTPIALRCDQPSDGYSAAAERWWCRVASAFVRWDAVYFLNIAKQGGYQYEQNMAFFPLYPALVRLIAELISAVTGVGATSDLLLVACALLLSNAAFCVAAVLLWWLSRDVLANVALADTATLLFLASPASVFLSAPYTESLFALTSLATLLALQRGRPILTLLAALASGATRSNALLLLAPAGVWLLMRMGRSDRMPSSRVATLALSGAAAGAALPVLAFQAWGERRWCASGVQAAARALMRGAAGAVAATARALGAFPRPYCVRGAWSLPAMYGFVQRHYWGVAPFAYYQMRQLPNFALAAPALLLAGAGVHAVLHRWRSRSPSGRACAGCGGPCVLGQRALWPHAAYAAVQMAVALTVLHVQVSTRFLSATPLPLWLTAHVLHSTRRRWLRALLLSYYAGYACAGTVLFCSFYPWT